MDREEIEAIKAHLSESDVDLLDKFYETIILADADEHGQCAYMEVHTPDGIIDIKAWKRRIN